MGMKCNREFFIFQEEEGDNGTMIKDQGNSGTMVAHKDAGKDLKPELCLSNVRYFWEFTSLQSKF